MGKVTIYPHERIDDLQTPNNRLLIQDPKGFCFGVDAVLLSDFAANGLKPGSTVLDMCTGNGIIPILLTEKCCAEHIFGVEIQETVAEMASRSVKLNGLENKITILSDDLKNVSKQFGKTFFDAVCCNPPYKEAGGGLKNLNDSVTIARHEILCNLEDIIENAEKVLKPYGKLFLIHRPERLADIICLMRKYRIEPKRLKFVHPAPKKVATMILIEGSKYGKSKLFLDPPLYVHDENGNYTEEIQKIYGRI